MDRRHHGCLLIGQANADEKRSKADAAEANAKVSFFLLSFPLLTVGAFHPCVHVPASTDVC
jgi:hypothetical protein